MLKNGTKINKIPHKRKYFIKKRVLEDNKIYKRYPINIPINILDTAWELMQEDYKIKNKEIIHQRESFDTFAYLFFYEILNFIKNGFGIYFYDLGFFFSEQTDMRKIKKKIDGTNFIFEDFIKPAYAFNKIFWRELLKYWNQNNKKYWDARKKINIKVWLYKNKGYQKEEFKSYKDMLNDVFQKCLRNYKCNKKRLHKFFPKQVC